MEMAPSYDMDPLINRILSAACYVFGPYDTGTEERRDQEKFLADLVKTHRRSGVNRIILKHCPSLYEDEED